MVATSVTLVGVRAAGAATDVRQMSVAALAASCGEQTSKFQRREPADDAFALELFRRAICARDELAWEAIFAQYRGLVCAWLSRHPAWPTVGDDADDWTYRVFERFWVAVTPARFDSFLTLAALLRYLKLCAHTALLDEQRARHAARVGPLSADVVAGVAADAEHVTLDRVTSAALWAVIEAEIKDEPERLVARSCLMRDIKPREVYARHPERFASVAEVYTTKRNLLDRLRRNPTIQRFLG